ncbi:MAG TPA: DinB family protein [Pyrinomonadaceae bacterium]|nr:DinB family protein [Pyrinomonadaceae bacterium]
MRKLLKAFLLSAILSLAITAGAQTPASTSPPPPAVASVVDGEIGNYEKLLIDVAEAMPEDKYDFTPASLGTKGGNYEGVRTFALLIKHTAAVNYFFWSPLTGDALPANIKGSNGPEELKTKAEIIKFLKDSFVLGHKAAATFSQENATEMVPFGKNKSTRLHLAVFAVIHAADEYGQMVEYLRMNGIVPPASRAK